MKLVVRIVLIVNFALIINWIHNQYVKIMKETTYLTGGNEFKKSQEIMDQISKELDSYIDCIPVSPFVAGVNNGIIEGLVNRSTNEK